MVTFCPTESVNSASCSRTVAGSDTMWLRYQHIFSTASPTQPSTSGTQYPPPPPHHPASPLLSQARSDIDTDEGVEKTHAKKAPLPLSLLHSDNDRLSSHSDQHCHPQHCRAQTHTRIQAQARTQTHTAQTRTYTGVHTHIHRTHGCENPHQPRQHWQPSHCCHFSYFYTGAWQHIKNPSRYGNNMRPLHQAH